MTTIRIERPRLSGTGGFHSANLLGDGSPEAASIDQQRLAASLVDAALPGLDVERQAAGCGFTTPRVLSVDPELFANARLLDRIDRYLWQGDLSETRATLVDPSTGHSNPADDDVSCPRLGDSMPRCGEPFTLAELMGSTQTLVLNDAQQRLGHRVADLVDQLAIAFRGYTQ